MEKEKLIQEMRKRCEKNQFYFRQKIRQNDTNITSPQPEEHTKEKESSYIEYFKFRFLICIILFFCITVVDSSISLTKRDEVQAVMKQIGKNESIEQYVHDNSLWNQWMQYLRIEKIKLEKRK